MASFAIHARLLSHSPFFFAAVDTTPCRISGEASQNKIYYNRHSFLPLAGGHCFLFHISYCPLCIANGYRFPFQLFVWVFNLPSVIGNKSFAENTQKMIAFFLFFVPLLQYSLYIFQRMSFSVE